MDKHWLVFITKTNNFSLDKENKKPARRRALGHRTTKPADCRRREKGLLPDKYYTSTTSAFHCARNVKD
jgi:hypothetical protein